MLLEESPCFDPLRFITCLSSIYDETPELIETHISWVFLLGSDVYKVKKPVNLGFLDFTSLSDRKYYCEEELRLNGRFSDLYLEVVPIGQKDDHYTLGDGLEPIEFAVRMQRFPSDTLFLTLLEQGRLERHHLESLGERIGTFHRFGCRHLEYPLGPSPQEILQHSLNNLEGLSALMEDSERAFGKALDQIRAWTQTEYQRHQSLFIERHESGVMVEAHGDLHLRNIVLLKSVPTPFDGIEFSETLRMLDPMNEIAFLIMDLEVRGAFKLGALFLNRYLEIAEDYAGLALLKFYKVYRACVRAKIALIDRSQSATPEVRHRATLEAKRYLDYALAMTQETSKPILMLLHGYSGSGKTTLANVLMPELQAIHLRTDQIRKSLEGLAPDTPSDPKERSRIYHPEQRDLVYQRMVEWGEVTLKSGFSLLLDATFLKASSRARALGMAHELGVPPLILSIACDETTTRSRIEERAQKALDASEATYAVYLQQKADEDPLSPEEMEITLRINSSNPIDWPQLLERIRLRPRD